MSPCRAQAAGSNSQSLGPAHETSVLPRMFRDKFLTTYAYTHIINTHTCRPDTHTITHTNTYSRRPTRKHTYNHTNTFNTFVSYLQIALSSLQQRSPRYWGHMVMTFAACCF